MGAEADLEARDAAIDAAIQGFPFMAREKAGRRLRERTVIIEEIAIAEQGDDVTVDFAGKVQLTAPRSGSAVEFTPPNGDASVQLSHQMRGPQLVQTMQGDKGGIRRIYTPQPGGELLMQVTLFTSRLPKPIEFDLHYELTEAGNTD